MFHILFVCTGNICRSAAAERISDGLLSDAPVAVSSAGIKAVVGHGIHPLTAKAVAAYGADAARPFAARQLSVAEIDQAVLILTAAREHRAATVTLRPHAIRKTFTLLEFCALVGTIDPLQAGPHALVREAFARRGSIPTQPWVFDLEDPAGAPAAAHTAMVVQIRQSLKAPLRLLANQAQLGGPSSVSAR